MAFLKELLGEYPPLANANDEETIIFKNAFNNIKNEDIRRAILESGLRFVVSDIGKEANLYVRYAVRDDKTIALNRNDFKYFDAGEGRIGRVRSLARTIAAIGLAQALKLDISADLVDKALANLNKQEGDDDIVIVLDPDKSSTHITIQQTTDNIINHGMRAIRVATPQQRLVAALSNAYSDKHTRLENRRHGIKDDLDKSCDAAAMQIYEMYMAALEKRKALKERHKPTKTSFVVNTEEGVLSAAQREYFGHLNKLLTFLNASPKTLNAHVSSYLSKQKESGLDAAALRFLPASELLEHFASGYIPMHEMFIQPAPAGAGKEKPLSPAEWTHQAVLAVLEKFRKLKTLDAKGREDVEAEIQALKTVFPKCAFSPAQEIDMTEEAERKAQIAQQKAEKAAEQEAQLQAQQERRLAEEAEKRAAFMAVAQPYVLSPDSANIVAQLAKYGEGVSASAARAREMIPFVESAAAALDIRSDKVKSMGDIIFSTANLVEAAKAQGAGNALSHVKAGLNKQANADRIRQWYREDPDVARAVDRMLHSDDTIVLLGSAIVGEAGTGTGTGTRVYADLLSGARIAMKKIGERIAGLEERIGDTSPKMLKEFADDPDVIALLDQRKKLTAEQAKIAKGRDILADEIWQAFQGKKVKRIKAAAEMPTAAVVDEDDSVIPETWLPLLGEEFQAVVSSNGDKYVDISNRAMPFMSLRVKRNTEKGIVAQEMSKLWAECNLVQHLKQDCGFELAGEGNNMTLRHPAYGIEAALQHGDKERAWLYQAEERFQERMLQQQSILRSLKQEGVGIENVDEDMHAAGAITLRHEVLPEGVLTLAPQGYMRPEGFAAAQKLLGTLIQRRAIAPAPEEEPEKKDVTATTWKPAPADTLMVFDASPLQILGAPRGGNGGRNWLDLIKQTAQLPNVKVIIPAVVADWELQGKIATYNEQGKRTGFEQITDCYQDPKHYLFAVSQPVQKFLASASRASMDENGKVVHFEPGANRNIIIMETPGDKKLYARIRAISRRNEKERSRLMYSEIYNQGHGEKAIERIIKGLPFANQFSVISNDLQYFRYDASHVSGKNQPVAHASLATYLDAEIAARAGVLQQRLGEQEALSIFRIAEELKNHQKSIDKQDRGICLAPYCHADHKVKNLLKPDTIYKTIAHGASLMEINSSASQKVPLMPGDWRRPPAKTITPDGIRSRPPGQGSLPPF